MTEQQIERRRRILDNVQRDLLPRVTLVVVVGLAVFCLCILLA